MELHQEILRHMLADGKIQVSFPELTNSDISKIVELECYRAVSYTHLDVYKRQPSPTSSSS